MVNDIFETKHISDVDFEILNDVCLINIFEYIILSKSDISRSRVSENYFTKYFTSRWCQI
jgi:hypothetical protein